MSGPTADLSREEIERYGRHLLLPEVGIDGQRRLKAGSVLLVGAGGLGSPLALYLAAAGVGRIGIADFDVVDRSNLQRQVLHETGDIGRPKIESARRRIEAINPHVEIMLHDGRLTAENALDILAPYDVIADGTDNFPARYLVNDACVLLGRPNAYGSVFRFEGQASVFDASRGPCYRCLYPDPPPPDLAPSCADGGVFGVLPGLIGMIQATETIKLLLGKGDPLIGRLLLYDALHMNFREMKIRNDPACPVCGENRTIDRLTGRKDACGLPGPIGAGGAGAAAELMPEDLERRLDRRERIVVLDVRRPHEGEICRIPGSILIPLDELPERFAELDETSEIVCYCRVGVRGARAALFLAGRGFPKVYNLAGGIRGWADAVDPTMPKY